MTPDAPFALMAGQCRIYRHQLAALQASGLQVARQVSRKFMPWYAWLRDGCLAGATVLVIMQITAANAYGCDVDKRGLITGWRWLEATNANVSDAVNECCSIYVVGR